MTYGVENSPCDTSYAGILMPPSLDAVKTPAVHVSRIASRGHELRISMISSCHIFCECLEEALRARAPLIEITSYANADDMSLDTRDQSPVNLAMIYIGLARAGDPSVCSSISKLATRFSIPIVVLGEGEALNDIKAAIDAGARGYVSTNMPLNVVVEALQMVRAGGMFIPASCIFSVQNASEEAPRNSRPTSDMIFTERQAAVVRALRQGMANKRIAYELNMCESTVKVHVRNIMRKLNARNRTEVAFRTNELFSGDDAP